MGYGRYSHEAHVAMTAARRERPQETVFVRRKCHPLMDPLGVTFRESRDSDEHPESLGIIFALDVSGSMGEIPHEMATVTLPRFMDALQTARINSPQVMFMAVGFAGEDSAPLQVGQFESSAALIDQWLTSMYLEGGGAGGNESYELAMYFAARHVRMDCVTERGQRGFLFITGDEPPTPAVSRHHVARLIGDTLTADIPIRDIIVEVQRTLEPFFLIPDDDVAPSVERAWRDLLGDRVVRMGHPDDTGDVAAGLISLLQGVSASLDALVGRLIRDGMRRQRAARIGRALQPFAASIGRDSAPNTISGATALPTRSAPSGMER
ncbi:MAG: VWA domain-containing protein [Myxococcota bacterium]